MFSCSVCTAPQSRWSAYFRAGLRGFYRCPNCKSYLQVSGRVTPAIVAAVVGLGFVILNFTVPVYPGSRFLWIAFQVFTVLVVYFGLLAWLMNIERRQPLRRFMF
jgi:hypothetical protein